MKNVGFKALYSLKFGGYIGNFKLVLGGCSRDSNTNIGNFYLNLRDRKMKVLEEGGFWKGDMVNNVYKLVSAGENKIAFINNELRLFIFEFVEFNILKE